MFRYLNVILEDENIKEYIEENQLHIDNLTDNIIQMNYLYYEYICNNLELFIDESLDQTRNNIKCFIVCENLELLEEFLKVPMGALKARALAKLADTSVGKWVIGKVGNHLKPNVNFARQTKPDGTPEGFVERVKRVTGEVRSSAKKADDAATLLGTAALAHNALKHATPYLAGGALIASPLAAGKPEDYSDGQRLIKKLS